MEVIVKVKMIFKIAFTVCAFWFLVAPKQAQACDLKKISAFQREIKQVEAGIGADLKEFKPGVSPVGDLICKNWSANPSQVIWAKLFSRHIRKGVDQIAALVGIFDFKQKKIIGTAYHSQFGVSGYARLKYIDIDTATYQVSSGQRAFGLKTGYISAEGKNLAMHEILSLYLPLGDGLRVLVDGVVLQKKFGEKGKKGCLVAYSEAKSQMSMVAKPGNKLKSFRITRQNKSFSGKFKKGKCLKIKPKSRAEKFDLDPPGYDVPVKFKHTFSF